MTNFSGAEESDANGWYKSVIQVLGGDMAPVDPTAFVPRNDASFELHEYYRNQDNPEWAIMRRKDTFLNICAEEIVVSYPGDVNIQAGMVGTYKKVFSR